MRILNRFALAAVAVLVVAAALTPAQAVCGGNPVIQTAPAPTLGINNSNFIWNGSTFTPGYYPAYPPYSVYGGPPWSPAFDGIFWALGTGNPVIGAGDDSGTWSAATYAWAYYNPTYYGGWYAGSIFAGWGRSAAIDGCVQNNPPTACTCVLLTDEDGTDGYYAITGNNADTTLWWTQLQQPGLDGAGNAAPIILQPIQRPSILNTVRLPSLDLDIDVTVVSNPGADYILGTCGTCGPIGFKVMEMIQPRGTAPPGTRQVAAWSPMTLSGGAPQPVTPIGGVVTVNSPCGAVNNDVYLATELHFDSGFTALVVSGNSTRIECGPNLAEPEKPRFRPGSQQGPKRPTRERQR